MKLLSISLMLVMMLSGCEDVDSLVDGFEKDKLEEAQEAAGESGLVGQTIDLSDVDMSQLRQLGFTEEQLSQLDLSNLDLSQLPESINLEDIENLVDGAKEDLPWGSWDDLNYVGMSAIHGARIVTQISGVRVGGSSTTWSQSNHPNWSAHTGIHNNPNAVLNLAFLYNGQWYMVPTEWLLPGMTYQQNKIYKSDRGNKHLWGNPVKYHEVTPGTPCAFVITDRWGSASERSNVAAFTR